MFDYVQWIQTRHCARGIDQKTANAVLSLNFNQYLYKLTPALDAFVCALFFFLGNFGNRHNYECIRGFFLSLFLFHCLNKKKTVNNAKWLYIFFFMYCLCDELNAKRAGSLLMVLKQIYINRKVAARLIFFYRCCCSCWFFGFCMTNTELSTYPNGKNVIDTRPNVD